MAELHLTPAPILDELKKNDVTHVVWLPDSETNFLFERMAAEPSIELVPVCREGEAMAIAAGLWVGGKKPVVLIQNTGMFESGDSIRGLALDIDFPMVMMVGVPGLESARSRQRLGRQVHRADSARVGHRVFPRGDRRRRWPDLHRLRRGRTSSEACSLSYGRGVRLNGYTHRLRSAISARWRHVAPWPLRGSGPPTAIRWPSGPGGG